MSGFDHYVLLTLVLVPMAGAVVLLLVPREQRQVIRWLAVLIGAAGFGLSLYVFVRYDHSAAGYQFEASYQWLQGLPVAFHLGVDGISAPLVLLTGIVMLAGALVSWTIETRAKDFFILFLLLVTGVFGVFTSLDLFFFFFFYELAVLPMYLLIGVWGSTRKEYGALKLTLYLVAGSMLVWIAIIALYVETGTFSIVELEQSHSALAHSFQVGFFPLFMIGFGVLAGLWPFHTWSPDGHVAAPTAVSMLHAGVLMKLGAYGILRLGIALMPEGAERWAPLLAGLGTVNVLYGAMSALAQKDLKYVIGYSSVSHMGYVLIGLAMLNADALNGAVLQMFSHGIMTALFFALVGVIYDRAHTRDIMVLGGLAKRMGVTAAFFAVAGLTSLGLPGLSGFIAEFLVFVGSFQKYPIVAVLGIIGAAITAVYILRLLARVFFGPISPQWEHLTDMSRLEGVATAGLVAVIVLVGVYPRPFLDMISASVNTLMQGRFT